MKSSGKKKSGIISRTWPPLGSYSSSLGGQTVYYQTGRVCSVSQRNPDNSGGLCGSHELASKPSPQTKGETKYYDVTDCLYVLWIGLLI